MNVLVLDNDDQQLKIAKRAAKKKGWKVIAENPMYATRGSLWKWIVSADAVVTDLMWPHENRGEKPMGLLVAIHAVFLRKPVVICTDSSKHHEGHHGEEIGFIFDGYIAWVREEDRGLDWEDHKDWGRAMDLLAERLKSKK